MDTLSSNDPLFKTCTLCKETKPLTEFYKRSSKQRGYLSWCKKCKTERYNERYASKRYTTHRTPKEEVPPGFKRCSKCRQIKPVTSDYFRRHKLKKGGLANQCKVCASKSKTSLLARIRKTKSSVLREDGTKRCSRCEEWKPATTEYFHRNVRQKTGLNSCCKQCLSEKRHEERRGQNPNVKQRDIFSGCYQGNKKIILENGTTQCSRCKQFKLATTDYFYALPKASTGLRPCCIECDKKHSICSESTSVEQTKQCAKCLQVKPATREVFGRVTRRKDHLGTICLECRSKSQLAYRTERREQEREVARQRRARNPQEYRTRNRNRKALQKNIPGKHTKEDIERQYKAQKGKCYWCGKKLNGTDYHVDHVIPVTREGSSNDPWNLVVACSFCNISRRNKLPHEWSKGGRLL